MANPGLLKALLHCYLVLPFLGLFRNGDLLKLLLHLPFLQLHLLLGLFPALLLHHHGVLLVGHGLLVLVAHHLVELCGLLCLGLFCMSM